MMSSIHLIEMHIREALLPTLNLHNLQQAIMKII